MTHTYCVKKPMCAEESKEQAEVSWSISVWVQNLSETKKVPWKEKKKINKEKKADEPVLL